MAEATARASREGRYAVALKPSRFIHAVHCYRFPNLSLTPRSGDPIRALGTHFDFGEGLEHGRRHVASFTLRD